jgi:hypothetical protein
MSTRELFPDVRVKVVAGDRDVLESGTVIAANAQPVDFVFPQPQRRPMVLRIEFATSNAPSTRLDMREGQTEGMDFLTITVINGLQPVGSGTKAPLRIGTISDRALYLSFWVSSLGQNNALLHYTLLLGEAAGNE